MYRECLQMSKLSNNISTPAATPSAYKWMVLGNVMIGTFMAVLDATVVNTGLPTIMGDLGASLNTSEWILTGYMLALAAMLPAAAWFAEKFGYKKVYFLALFLFTFSSFMCGNSRSIEELIFWRIIEGIGSGAIMPIGMAIVTKEFPPEERGVALGFWAVASAASVSFGPLIGGYLVDNFNWNYIFYINVPIGVIGILITLIIQKENKSATSMPFDIPGIITSSIFLPVFLYGLTEVNSSTNAQGWNSPIVMGCMFASGIFFILFIVVELSVSYPLIDLRLLKERNFAITNIVLFVFAIGMFGSTFLIPLYLQESLGYSAYQSGFFFLPVGFIQGVVSPIAGQLNQRINPKILIIAGLIIMAISFYMNYYLSYMTESGYIYLSLYFRGAGMGMVFSPLMAVSLNNIPVQKIAQASSISNIIRQVGGSFGVALFSYQLTQRTNYHTEIYNEQLNYTSQIYRDVVSNISQFLHTDASVTKHTASEISEQLIISHINSEAYIGGINDVFFIVLALTLISILPVFFLKIKKRTKSTKPDTVSTQIVQHNDVHS